MKLFRKINNTKPLTTGKFAVGFAEDAYLQTMLKSMHKTVKILPFDADRDMKHIRLLYPAWTARELGLHQNIKSNLSRLHMLSQNPENFITCLVRGDISFILGFNEGNQTKNDGDSTKEANIINVYMLSGKPLKEVWGHRFADIFSYWLGCLAKTYIKYFIVASCDKNIPVYNKFTEAFGFSFWSEYPFAGTAGNLTYNSYIFNEVV